jgi:hypothetical protein
MADRKVATKVRAWAVSTVDSLEFDWAVLTDE